MEDAGEKQSTIPENKRNENNNEIEEKDTNNQDKNITLSKSDLKSTVANQYNLKTQHEEVKENDKENETKQKSTSSFCKSSRKFISKNKPASLRHRSYSSKANPLIDIANLIDYAFDSNKAKGKEYTKDKKSWDYFQQVTSNLNSNKSENSYEYEKDEFVNLNQKPENKESLEQNDNICSIQEDSQESKHDDANTLHINSNLKYEKCFKKPQNQGSSVFETCNSDFGSEHSNNKHSRSTTKFLPNDLFYGKKRKAKSCLSHSSNLLQNEIKSTILNSQPFCDLNEEQIAHLTLETDDLISSLSINPTLKLLMMMYKNKVDDVHLQTDVIRCTCQAILYKVNHLPCLHHLDKKVKEDEEKVAHDLEDITKNNAKKPDVKEVLGKESKEDEKEINKNKKHGGNTNQKEDENKNTDKEERNDENIEDQIDDIGSEVETSEDEVNSFADHISLNSSPVPFSVSLKDCEATSIDKKVFYDDCNVWNNKKYKKKSFKKRFMRKSIKKTDLKEKNSNLSKSCDSDSDYNNDGYEGDEEKDGLVKVCGVEEVCEFIKKISECCNKKEIIEKNTKKVKKNDNTKIKKEFSEKNIKDNSWLKCFEEINTCTAVNNETQNVPSKQSELSWKTLNKSINNHNISNNIMPNRKQKLIIPFYPKSSDTGKVSLSQESDDYLKKIQFQYVRACKLNAIALGIDKSKKNKTWYQKACGKKQVHRNFNTVKFLPTNLVFEAVPQPPITPFSVPPLTEHDNTPSPEVIKQPHANSEDEALKKISKFYSSPEITTNLSQVSIKPNFDDKNTTLRDFVYKKSSETSRSSTARSTHTFLAKPNIEKFLASFKNLNLYNIDKESVLQWKIQMIKLLFQGATMEDLCRLKRQLYSLPKKSVDTLKDVPSFPMDSSCSMKSGDACKKKNQGRTKSIMNNENKKPTRKVVVKSRVKFKKTSVNLKVIERLKNVEKTAVKLLGMYTNNNKIVRKITTNFLCSKNKMKTFTINCGSLENRKKSNFDWESLEIVENILDKKTTETMTQNEKDYVGEVYSKLISRISNEIKKDKHSESDSFQEHVFLVDENQNKMPLKTEEVATDPPISQCDAVSPFVEKSEVDLSVPAVELQPFKELKKQEVVPRNFFVSNENTVLKYVSRIFEGHPGDRTLLPTLQISLDQNTLFEFNFLKNLPCECFLNSFQNMITSPGFAKKAGIKRRIKAIKGEEKEDDVEKENNCEKFTGAQVFDKSKLKSFFKKTINKKETFPNLTNFENFIKTKENKHGDACKNPQSNRKKNCIEVLGNSQFKNIFKVFSENSKLETTTIFHNLSWQSFHSKPPLKVYRTRKDAAYNKENVFNKNRLTRLLKNTKKILEAPSENGSEVVISQTEQIQGMSLKPLIHCMNTSTSKTKSRTDSLIKSIKEKTENMLGRSASERKNTNLNSGYTMSSSFNSSKTPQNQAKNEVNEKYKYFNKIDNLHYNLGQGKLELNESKIPKRTSQIPRHLMPKNNQNINLKYSSCETKNRNSVQQDAKSKIKNFLQRNINSVSKKMKENSGVHLINSNSHEEHINLNIKLNDYTGDKYLASSSDEMVTKSKISDCHAKGKKITKLVGKKKVAKTNTKKKNLKLVNKETVLKKINKNSYDLSSEENTYAIKNYSPKTPKENFKKSFINNNSCSSSKMNLSRKHSKKNVRNTTCSSNHEIAKTKTGKNKNDVTSKGCLYLTTVLSDFCEDENDIHANVERFLMNEKENNKSNENNKNTIAYNNPNNHKLKTKNSFESLFNHNINSPFTKKNLPYRIENTSQKKKTRKVLGPKGNEKINETCSFEKPIGDLSNLKINEIQEELFGDEISSENIEALKSYLLSENIQNVERAFKSPTDTDNSPVRSPLIQKLIWDKSGGSLIRSSSIPGLTDVSDSTLQFSSYKVPTENLDNHERWDYSTRDSSSEEILLDKWERISGVNTGLFDSTYTDNLHFTRISWPSKALEPISTKNLKRNSSFELNNKYEKIVEDSKNQKFQKPRTHCKNLSTENCLEDAKTMRRQSVTSNNNKSKPPKIISTRNFLSKPQALSHQTLNTSTTSSAHSIHKMGSFDSKHSSSTRNTISANRFSLASNKAV